MTETEINTLLNSSREHAIDLLEASEYLRAMPSAEDAAHRDALAARLQTRAEAIQKNIGSLI